MEYLRKYLQKVGLVLTLLIGGVLGGLVAPLPAVALPPTVTLKVDNGDPVSILSTTNTSSTCTSTEVTLGFTHCYAINTTLTVVGVPPTGSTLPQRSYLVRNAPGATARLRVGDNAGSDKFSLIGVQFVPAPLTGQTVANWGSTDANTNETHVLTIAMSNAFDSAVNVNNKGTYVWALRAGGEFRAGPAATGACGAAACNNIGNSVTFPGTGTFSPTLTNKNILTASNANSQPLSLTVAGPTSAIVSFDGLTNATLGQVNPTYPTFICDLNGGTLNSGDVCKPSITQTMTVTLKGPDSFVLVNGGDMSAGWCETTLTTKQQKEIAFLTKLVAFLDWWEVNHPNPRIRAFINQIETFLAVVNSPATDPPNCSGGVQSVNLDLATFATLDQVAFAADGAVPAVPVPTGTITLVKNLNVICETPCTNQTFNFRIKNQTTEVETTHSVETGGTGTGTTTVTVPAGTYNVVEDIPSGWNLTASSCNGGNTNGVTVEAGSTVPCNFTNSPSTGNDLGTIRLSWGAAPLDLDSHLYIPNGYEVAFFAHGSLVASPYANLDLDDTTSFGPENITVVRRMKGTYQYFVHNWSDRANTEITNPMTNSPAKVELIRNGITTTYNPPPGEGTNRYWHVFNAVVDSETCAVRIDPVNLWLASPPPLPIPQSEVLCP